MDELQLTKPFSDSLREFGCREDQVQQLLLLLRIGVLKQGWFDQMKKLPLSAILKDWFSTTEIQYQLHVNRYQDILWYNREAFDELAWWLSILPIIQTQGDKQTGAAGEAELVLNIHEIMDSINKLEKRSNYQVENFLELAQKKDK